MSLISVAGLFLIFALAILLLSKEGLFHSTRNIVVSTSLLVAALMLRLYWFDYKTLDYIDFLHPWVNYFREYGGFAALKHSVGNYNVPYLYFLALFSYFKESDWLYLIKLLSVFFEVILAYASMKLVSLYCDSENRQLLAFFGVLYLPTVLLNGSVWGQCDVILGAFSVLALYLALADRPIASMVCFAAAFAVKLQAVFILPIIAVLWYRGKFKLWHSLIFPASYIAIVMPAVLMGRPFWDTVTLYLNQTGSIGSGLNYNSSSVFAFFPNESNVEFWSTAGVVIAFAFMFAILIWLYLERHNLNYNIILTAALLLSIGIPFLLPHMHDRYFFIADVLALAFGIVFPKLCFIPVFVQFASLLGYHAYLKMRYLMPMRNGAIALIIAMSVLIAFIIYHLPAIDQEKVRK
ncbi:MAG: DUF2029 domain-containing protein [Oscillospiraceae bacterium]|nr:DUF2029 domain-containing protein [Oscillospiraceae bacterium]